MSVEDEDDISDILAMARPVPKRSVFRLAILIALNGLGLFFLFLYFLWTHVCTGAIGSGIRCRMPFTGFENLIALWEISFAVGIGFLTLALMAVPPITLLFALYRFVRGYMQRRAAP